MFYRRKNTSPWKSSPRTARTREKSNKLRVAIEFEVLGSTLPLMINEAKKSWKDLMEDIDAEIPADAELHVTPHAGSDYAGKVFVRMKVDNAE